MGLQSKGEFLCLEGGCCIAANAKQWDTKLDTTQHGNQYCLCSLPFIEMKVKKPETIIAVKSKLFCLNEVASLPFRAGYVDKPVCGICFLRAPHLPILFYSDPNP